MAASSVKVTKKPAKKRAEARLEPDEHKEPQEPQKPDYIEEQNEQKQPVVQLQPEIHREPVVHLTRLEDAELPVPTVAEAQTTHKSPERQTKEKSPSPSPLPHSIVAPLSPTVSNGGYELSFCTSSSHAANTFSYSYADHGSKPAQPVPRQPANYSQMYEMRVMIDKTVHTMRITSPQLLHQSLSSSSEDGAASAVSIRNIPKKRLIPISEKQLAKPQASSTPLAATSSGQGVEHDDNDHEVASM